MALLAAEVARLKYELGFNVLAVGAEPYISITSLFEQVIQPYVTAGATTTSTTSFTPDTVGEFEPVTLTIASATGFDALARVVVDVDARQEIATAQSVSGSTVTLLLSQPHSGTYPVTVEGGESILRELLGSISQVANELGEGFSSAGIQQVDEIKFFRGSDGGSSRIEELRGLREYYRRELASALGIPYPRGMRQRAGSSIALY